MEKVEFKIRQGMSAKELMNEISGKISGETQQQIELLERNLKTKGAEMDYYLDPIREYAVVRITVKGKDAFGFLTVRYLHFLMGVNDEGFYFAHEIDEMMVPKVKGMESFLEWINRADQGFAERVQGDVLMQFAKMEDLTGRSDRQDPEFQVVIPPIGAMHIRHNNNLQNPSMGGHQIIGEKVYHQGISGVTCFIVTDRKFKLQHPQHGITTIEVPKDHVAVMTHQRGRVIHDNQGAWD